MKRFIVVAICLLAFGYLSSRGFESQAEPWESGKAIVIEYTQEELKSVEKKQ